ncbi:MAG: response regulator, partial [Lewinella sp.]|nr:response regulator [Lewinella sp.]
GGGTGIGLALSKDLVELMGGGIAVESPGPGGPGSVFTFWLPMTDAAPRTSDELSAQTSEHSASPGGRARPRADFGQERPLVLLVEDNTDLRHFIRQSIGDDWEIVEAADGAEGLRKAVELVPELVISDVMMPFKDGYALCDELKAHELTAHVPVILLTAKSAMESKLQGLRTGADDYLTKPFYTEELVARMENLVVTRRKLRAFYGSQPIGQPQNTGEQLPALDREFLHKLTTLLEEHLSEEQLGVEDFARKLFISRSQLHRKLKAITGRSATDFIRDFRLERAYELLRRGEGLVGEISLRVGFGNEKYFSTAFKDKYGMPPSRVRPGQG